jgi:hypothetical protein
MSTCIGLSTVHNQCVSITPWYTMRAVHSGVAARAPVLEERTFCKIIEALHRDMNVQAVCCGL